MEYLPKSNQNPCKSESLTQVGRLHLYTGGTSERIIIMRINLSIMIIWIVININEELLLLSCSSFFCFVVFDALSYKYWYRIPFKAHIQVSSLPESPIVFGPAVHVSSSHPTNATRVWWVWGRRREADWLFSSRTLMWSRQLSIPMVGGDGSGCRTLLGLIHYASIC